MSDKARTLKQNAALHKWLEMLAEQLNDAGYSVNDKMVIHADIGFTKDNLKTSVVHPIMTALYPDITSTAKLDKQQIQEVYLYANRAISHRTNVSVAWPSEDQL